MPDRPTQVSVIHHRVSPIPGKGTDCFAMSPDPVLSSVTRPCYDFARPITPTEQATMAVEMGTIASMRSSLVRIALSDASPLSSAVPARHRSRPWTMDL